MSAQPTQTPLCAVAGIGPSNGAAFARRFVAEGHAVALLVPTTGLTNKLTNKLPVARACDVGDPADDMGARAASSLRCLPSQPEKAEIDFVARRHQLRNRGVARTPKDTNLNRAGAVVRRLLLWCFRNRETGAITVAQTPNLALSAFLVATAILWLMHPNVTISTAAKVVATGSLIVWALDEVVRGVNPWRRFLGVAVLIYVVSTVRL